MSMRRWLFSSLGLLVALGCAAAESNAPALARGYERQPIPAHLPESVRACYEHPDTQKYLELAARAEAAIRETQPFGPVPAAASCLVTENLEARFATFRTGASE